MKRPLLIVITLLFISCTNSSKPEKKTVPHADKTTVEAGAELAHISFPISGMTCEVGCAARIEKKVAAADGVAASKVDFASETAYVSFDPNQTSFEAIRTTIEKLGDDYKVGDAQASSPYSIKQKEGKKCDKSCEKECCASAKKKCDKSCEKECCASKKHMDKKACKADCTKACCAKKKEKV